MFKATVSVKVPRNYANFLDANEELVRLGRLIEDGVQNAALEGWQLGPVGWTVAVGIKVPRDKILDANEELVRIGRVIEQCVQGTVESWQLNPVATP